MRFKVVEKYLAFPNSISEILRELFKEPQIKLMELLQSLKPIENTQVIGGIIGTV